MQRIALLIILVLITSALTLIFSHTILTGEPENILLVRKSNVESKLPENVAEISESNRQTEETEPTSQTTKEENSKKPETRFPSLKQFESDLINLSGEAQKYLARIYVTKIVKLKLDENNPKEKETKFKTYLNFSGIVIQEDGYILTLAGPVKDSENIKVYAGGERYNGKIKAIDNTSQLAIIKIDAKNLTPVPFSDKKLRSALLS